MAGESLTVFERRFDDWSINHPRRWVATTDRDDAARFISEQTKEIRRAQLEAADRIIVSQDRIASAIDEVGVVVERVADGIEGLEAAFEWGFSEIVWHLEQERAVLKDILKVLQAPLDTQAKELRQRAEEAYRSGWIDDALEDFLESERKNRYDFTVHHSIGSIYLFHKKAPEKALEYFEKAAKYATPKSSYHASLAFLHMGLTRSLQEDYEKAYEATLKAIELSPNLSEAHYQCAQYCASLGKYDEAIDRLRQAIRGDRNYCLKAQSEKDFDLMRDPSHLFLGNLRDDAQSQAEKELEITQGLIQYADRYDLPHSDKGDKFADTLRGQKEAADYSKRASLFDCWHATYKTRVVQGLILDVLESFIRDQMSKTEEGFEQKKLNREDNFWYWGCIPGGIIGCIVGLKILVHIFATEGSSGPAETVCALVPGFVMVGIFGSIGGVILWPIGALLSLPIFISLTQKRKARYKSKLSELHANLSEVQAKGKQQRPRGEPAPGLCAGARVRGGVLTTNIGVETLGGMFTHVIDKGQTVPCTRKEIFSTAADNQGVIVVGVFEGDASLYVSDCLKIGTYAVSGFTQAPRGVPQIEIEFALSEDGTLLLTGRDLSTNERIQVIKKENDA